MCRPIEMARFEDAVSVPAGTLIAVESEQAVIRGEETAGRELGGSPVGVRADGSDPILAAVAAARREDRLRALRVVGSDRRTSGTWNRLIEAQGALFDVAVLTPQRLARECVPAVPQAPVRLHVRAAMRNLLRAYGLGAGLLDSALGVWSQLDSSSTGALLAAEQAGDEGIEPLGWVGPAYRDFVPAMAARLDGAGETAGAVLRRATAELSSIAGGCLPFDVVVAVDVASWSPAAVEFVRALCVRGDVEVACVGWGDLATVGLPARTPLVGPKEVGTQLEVTAAVVPTAADEAVWVTGVVGAWRAEGVPIEEIAVVVPAEPRAGVEMRSALESSGLLVRTSRPPADLAETACLLRLQLLVDDAEAADVAGLAALVPEQGAAWVRWAREWGVLRGVGAWRAAAALRQDAPDQTSERTDDAHHLGAEEHFAAWLVTTLDEVATAAQCATWSDWARVLAEWCYVPTAGAAGLAEGEEHEQGAPPGTLSAPDAVAARASSRLRTTIDQLASLDRWEPKSRAVDARLVLSELRAGLDAARSRDEWRGASVVSAVDLPLRPWAGLVITGLSEGRLPRPAHRHPLVGPAAAELFRLPSAEAVARHEEAVLVEAAAGAGRVALCRASHDGGGRSRDSSMLWDLLLARVGGSSVVASFDSPLAVLADRAARGGESREDMVLADSAYRTAVGLDERPDWRSRPDAALEALVVNPALLADPGAVGRLEVMARRRPAEWGKFEGVVGSSWDPPEKISPTSLERFAQCPRRYFFAHGLGIRPLSDPDDELDLAPRDRGIAVHEVLCRLVAQALERSGQGASAVALINGAVATDPQAFAAAGSDIVESGVIDRWISDALARLGGGRVRLGHVAEHSMVARAVGAVWSELRSDVAVGWMPVATEFRRRFRISQLVPGRSLLMDAQIDRLDRHVNGSLRVVDYKTSSAVSQTELARRSVRALLLQPTLYAAAIAELAGALTVRAELWFVGSNWARAVVPACPPNVLTTLFDALDAGAFPFHPGEASTRSGFDFENCGYCEFRSSCPSDRGRRWQAAQDAEEIGAYRRFLAAADQAANDLDAVRRSGPVP